MKDEYAQFVVAQIREAEAKLTEAKRALAEIKKELRDNPYGADFEEQSQLLIDVATEILWAQAALRLWDKRIPRYVIVEEAQYQNLQLAAFSNHKPNN